MALIAPQALADFNTQIGRLRRQPSFFMKVVEKADDPDPDIYAGLIRTPHGFFRVAYDEQHQSLILLASKTADNLRGTRDQGTDHIRPTPESMARVYGIAARRLRRPALLPADMAEFFIDRAKHYTDEIGKLSNDKFAFYGVRIGEDEIYTNSHVAYVIEKNKNNSYSVRVLLPSEQEENNYVPSGIRGRWQGNPLKGGLLQKYICKNVSRAEAHHQFALHIQTLSSKLWDHVNVHETEGPTVRLAKVFTNLINYPKKHAPSLVISTGVAGGFMMSKESHLGLLIGAWAILHAASDISLKEAWDHALDRHANRKEAKKHASLDSFGIDDDCIKFFLKPDITNLARPWPHLNPERCNAEGLRFLTFEEIQPIAAMLQTSPQSNLQPGSLRGLVTYGNQRGFTRRVCYPAPGAEISMYQNGLIVLKLAIDTEKTEMFVTYRPDACVTDRTRLPEAYIDQAQSGIQHIIHNRHLNADSTYEEQTISFEEMQAIIKDRLFSVTGSSPNNFIPPVAQQYQTEAWRFIEELFNPSQEPAHKDLFMGGYNPPLPTIGCIPLDAQSL